MISGFEKCRKALAAILWLQLAVPLWPQELVLRDGTPVKLRLARNMCSADAQIGESVDFEVLEEVAAGGTVVIAKGATAIGTVTEAQPKRRMGRAGKLNMNIDYVRLANGQKVALRAVKEAKGGSNAGKVTGAVVATSLVFFPAAPLFLFAKGKDVTVPKGTEVTAFVNGDTKVDPRSLQAPAAVPGDPAVKQPAPEGKPLTNEDVIELKGLGFSDDVLIAKIKASPGNFRLETKDMSELKAKGISDAVIAAMLAR
jgi:hypothetical protein